MPTPKQPNGAKKRAKAEVQWCFQRRHANGKPAGLHVSDRFQYVVFGDRCVPCVVLPMPSKRAAHEFKKALPIIQALFDNPAKKKWEAMSEAQKRAKLRNAIAKDINQWLTDSLTPDRGYSTPIDNVWSLIQGGPTP